MSKRLQKPLFYILEKPLNPVSQQHFLGGSKSNSGVTKSISVLVFKISNPLLIMAAIYHVTLLLWDLLIQEKIPDAIGQSIIFWNLLNFIFKKAFFLEVSFLFTSPLQAISRLMETYLLTFSHQDTFRLCFKRGKKKTSTMRQPKPQKSRCPSTACFWQTSSKAEWKCTSVGWGALLD